MDTAYGDSSSTQLLERKLLILCVSLILTFVTAAAARVTFQAQFQ